MQSLPIRKFHGLYTRTQRANRPPGALDAMENFVVNSKIGSLVQRTGYTADLNNYITDVSGATTVSTFDRIFMPSTEVPESKDFYVITGKASGVPKFFQRPFYWGSATAKNSWLDWNETLTGTISSKGTNTFVISGAGQSDSYYNGFCGIDTTAGGGYFIVTGYVAASGTFTILPNIPSTWSNGDSVTLFRGFHDNPAWAGNANGITPTWVDPCVLKQGNNILASGGQSSNNGCRPLWSGYVNQTFFSGSTPVTFQGTYVTEAEIKSYLGMTITAVSGASAAPLDAAYYEVAYSLQTIDGQRGPLIRVGEVNITGSNEVDISATVYIGSLNKRIRYVNLYVASNSSSTSTPAWSTYNYVGVIDLQSTGWVFTQTSGSAYGYHKYTFNLTKPVWLSKGSDGVSDVGFTETDSYVCSFSRGIILAGRLFVGLFYDYGNSTYYYDEIRYSPFNGAGVSSYNVLPDIPGFNQSTIEAGDPNRITNIGGTESYLILTKTKGVYYIDLTADATTWVLQTLTKEIGCNAPHTMVTTPFGTVFVNSGDDVYLIVGGGGQPQSLMRNYLGDFRAIVSTYASQWYGWYDKTLKAYRFTISTDGSTFTTVYEIEFEVQVPVSNVEIPQGSSWLGGQTPAIVKHIFTDNIVAVCQRSDGVIFFTTGGNITEYFDSTSATDGGTAIGGYFKIDGIVFTEMDYVALIDWYISQTPSGSTVRTLVVNISLDGNLVQSLGVTGTATYLRTEVPPMGSTYSNLGRKVSIEYNANAIRAAWTLGNIINEIGFTIDERKLVGDKRQSL